MGTMPPPVGAQVPRPRMQPVAPPPPLQAAQPRVSTAPRAASLPAPRPSGAARPAAASPFRRLDDRLGAALDAGGDGGSIGGRAHRCCLCLRDRHQPGARGGRAGLEVVDPRATIGTTKPACRSGEELHGPVRRHVAEPRSQVLRVRGKVATHLPAESRQAAQPGVAPRGSGADHSCRIGKLPAARASGGWSSPGRSACRAPRRRAPPARRAAGRRWRSRGQHARRRAVAAAQPQPPAAR